MFTTKIIYLISIRHRNLSDAVFASSRVDDIFYLSEALKAMGLQLQKIIQDYPLLEMDLEINVRTFSVCVEETKP